MFDFVATFAAIAVVVAVVAGVVLAHNCRESNEEALIDPICGSFN